MANKPTRHYSKKQEKRVAASLGLRVTANSGATHFDKGDATDKYLMMECKTVTKKQASVSLKKEWFTKNREEMFARGKEISALAFDFGDGEEFVAVPMRDFAELYEAWKELREEE